MKLKSLLMSLAAALPLAVFSSPDYIADPTEWTFGGDVARMSAKKGIHYAVVRTEDAHAVEISAEVTPTDLQKVNEWPCMGVTIGIANWKNWRLALVSTPNCAGRGIELGELYSGVWPAQVQGETKLATRIADPVKKGAWKLGETYRLTLKLDAKGVLGEVRDAAGELLMRDGYVFADGEKAVRFGHPSLLVQHGLGGTFAKVEVKTSSPVGPADWSALYRPFSGGRKVKGVKGKATGFFHVEKDAGGRWWVIDPEGDGTLLCGAGQVHWHGFKDNKTGKMPYLDNNKAKYGTADKWRESTASRLKTWGFNALGGGCDDSKMQHESGLAYTLCMGWGIGDSFTAKGEEFAIEPGFGYVGSSFPNVFHPKWPAYCEHYAKAVCGEYRGDPWVAGYFTDNELSWRGRGDNETGLFDSALERPAGHPAKGVLCNLLQEKAGGSIERFNATWKTTITSWFDLPGLKKLDSRTEEQKAIKREFLRLAAERYFKYTAEAVHRAAPGHMVLGARFAGAGQAVWEVAGKYCDAVTFNCYPWADLDRNVVYSYRGKNAPTLADNILRKYALVKRPVMITEWAFPALDSGLPCLRGGGQRFRTQAERCQASELFVRTVLSLPCLVGEDVFMWADDPPGGNEDCNYGLVNIKDEPYEEFVKMFTRVNAESGEIHRAGRLPKVKAVDAPPAMTTLEELKARARAAGGSAATDVKFVRNGDSFKLTNAAGLSLSGAIGRSTFLDSVALNGKYYSHYSGMVETATKGRKNWLHVGKVTRVSYREDGPCGVLEIAGTCGGSVPFELVHRLTVAPKAAEFVAEVVSLKNIGTEPFDVGNFYFTEVVLPWGKVYVKADENVPALWKGRRESRWYHKDDHRYIGGATSDDGFGSISFWLEKSGQPHCDARFSPGGAFTVEPGETWTYDGDVGFLVFLGQGDAPKAAAKRTNGPKVSILGDSYSTFEGAIPAGYENWYKVGRNGVGSVGQTWWMQTIDRLGGTLEKNDAWSGATICSTGYGRADFTSRSFVTRANRLGDPDVVLVCGGTNDSWCGAPIGEEKWSDWSKEDLKSFKPAMAKLCSELKSLYPKARICFILNDGLKPAINDHVRLCCRRYKIDCVELKGISKRDGHPDAKGMTQIAEQVFAVVGKKG